MRHVKRVAALLLAGTMLFSGVPAGALAVEPQDTGGLCEHHPVHTDACGYQTADADAMSAPCTNVCTLCQPQDDAAVPECICETRCTADAIASDCPICGAADADLAACAGEPAQTRQITGFADLPERVRAQAVPAGTALDALDLPDTLEAFDSTSARVTVDGVIWTVDPAHPDNQTNGVRAYAPEQPGTVVFSPVLPDTYTLAEGAQLPDITVQVEKQAQPAPAPNADAEEDGLTAEFMDQPRADGSVTVETPDQFMAALKDSNVTMIQVNKDITLGDKADTDQRMLPIEIPGNKTIIGGGSKTRLVCRAPIQLTGDDVTFRNIGLVFTSTNALGSIPHREIFLAGHSLTMDNVNTFLEGGDDSLGDLGGSEKELLPTVYAGGYHRASGSSAPVGNNASLTVENANDETIFQAIYMGHGENPESYKSGRVVSYTGAAALKLDARTRSRDGISTAQSSSAAIDISAQGSAVRIQQFTGNTNTTLTLDNVSLMNAEIHDVGTIKLQGQNTSLTVSSGTLGNVSVPADTSLNLTSLGDAVITGDFSGGGQLAFDQNGSVTIGGTISGTTEVAAGGFLPPKPLTENHVYIKGDGTSNPDAFQLVDKHPYTNSFSLNYMEEKGGWVAVKQQGGGDTSQITSFSMQDVTVQSGMDEAKLPVTITDNTGADTDAIADMDDLTIKINGNVASLSSTGTVSYIEQIADLELYFSPDGNPVDLIVVPYTWTPTAVVPDGTYHIEVTIPGTHTVSSQPLTATAVLTVGTGGSTTTTITGDMVTLSPDSVTYDGQEHKPAVTVKDSSGTLTENTNYTVSYQRSGQTTTDFTNAGAITVVVKGIGSYAGTVEKTYTIAKAPAPQITWPTASNLTFGQLLEASTLTGGSTQFGSFAWKEPKTRPNAGSAAYLVVFTPNEGTKQNYQAIATTEQDVTVAVAQIAMPQIAWPTASNLIYGQALSSSTLTGGDTVYGSFAWKEPDTIPGAGTAGYPVTFTPDPQTEQNYKDIPTEQAVQVTVGQAMPDMQVDVTVRGAAGTQEAEIAVTVTGVPNGGVPTGTIAFASGSSLNETVALNGAGKAVYVWKGLDQPQYTVQTTYSGDSNYAFTSKETLIRTDNQPTKPVTGVKLDQTALTLKAGNTAKLTATVAPADASNRAVTWSSNKDTVAQVDQTGLVKAIAPGSATITVTTADGAKTATCVVTVEARDPGTVPVTGVELDQTALTLKAGNTAKLTATVAPAGASNRAVIWSSNKDTVAQVDQTGLVKAVAPGSATITVTTADGGKTATCVVTVEARDPGTVPVTGVELDQTALTLKAGNTAKLTATVAPADASNRAVAWSSDKDTVAQVDQTGLVKAVAPGSATITVTTADGGKTATCVVTVRRKSSGSSGSSSSGSASDSSDKDDDSIVERPTGSRPDTPTTAETNPVKPDRNGDAAVNHSAVQSAIRAAQKDAKERDNTERGIAVVVPVDTDRAQEDLQVTIKAQTLDALIDADVQRFTVIADEQIGVCLDLDALKQLKNAQKKHDIVLDVEVPQAQLSQQAQAAIGSRPVYDVTLYAQAGGSKTPIRSLDGRKVTLQLPYTPAQGEQESGLHAVYVDEAGKIAWLADSYYDADLEAVILETDHFSLYGVGYQTPVPAFTDVNGHWAADHIRFVVSRGLFSGTSDTTFSPDTGMTRGMFVTALGRLAGIDPAKYRAATFLDVSADAYYAPYINWAAQTGVVSGTTADTFSPDEGMTREQMAVILTNYVRRQGDTLPQILSAVAFADDAQIGSWAREAVRAMQQAGILAGKDGNRFDPQGTATRAEVAAVLRRFVETVADA